LGLPPLTLSELLLFCHFEARKIIIRTFNKFEMENEPSGSNINNQYALKQGLNLSSSLGLEVREETSFD
jgi:hypothetical protein